MSEILKVKDTRRQFIDDLCELAHEDKTICLIIPDVGFNYADKFSEMFPERFFNLGVTEQSCMIIASAMALDGMKPYVYSMINFVTFRVHEMVRNAVCLHDANVKILGVKGSEKYKFLGFSHNMIREDEEIDFLSQLPNMTTYVATNPAQVHVAMLDSYKSEKATYIRL